MKKPVLLTILLFSIINLWLPVYAQEMNETTVKFLPDEYWWGAFVQEGRNMPYISPIGGDLNTDNRGNQATSLFLSNKGRYIWSDKPVAFSIKDSSITIKSPFEKVEVKSEGNTLRDAYLKACETHFTPTGKIPDPLFFSKPQYNTWIELMYNQNQEDILKYARAIIDNGFPTGVLMIDDNWQRYYGNFDFKAEKFSDPRGMINQLHDMGFKVMVWICPFVSPDSPEYRVLRDKGYLIKNKKSNDPAMIGWWNGISACYDLTNPEAYAYLAGQLREAQRKYGIDGYKFDAGDVGYYRPNSQSFYDQDAVSTDHSKMWAQLGTEFSFNEYRACWSMQGEPLVQRLGDKGYDWGAVKQLIPDMLAAGLLGWAYTCPDMIGGGLFTSFLEREGEPFQQNLLIRSAQVHAMMPMMQFSVAPWRVLDKENLEIVCRIAHLHEKMGSYILELAEKSAQTGEPIVRHLEYSFPGEGFAQCKDQFMLGDKYLVAPILTPDNNRTVRLPKGRWIDDQGKKYKGGKEYRLHVSIDRLLFFEKI